MPGEDGAVAVAEAPVVDAASTPDASTVDTESTGHVDTEQQQDDKTDGRKQPDALRKRIADLRRQADSIADPAEKQRLLDDAKRLNDGIGKVRAYETVYPTVREAKEAKTLIDSLGGREGLTNLQGVYARVQEIDHAFEVGDPSIIAQMWEDAPDGMVKLAPAIFARLEQANPQAYEKAIVPHAVKFFDNAGFPEAFDEMVGLYQKGQKEQADALAQKLGRWFSGQRQATQNGNETKSDPEKERLQRELQERDQKANAAAIDRAYNDVVAHAAPVIDKYLKPIVAKLGLSKEQYEALREDTWKHLQDTRNSDATYKTVAKAKYAQGVDKATEYIKQETENRAEDAARSRANFWYGHQLRNGAVATKKPATAAPVSPSITRGKEPSPSEIDYGPKGIAAAKKAGFKDLGDMILAGKAPLKAGGIRQWR